MKKLQFITAIILGMSLFIFSASLSESRTITDGLLDVDQLAGKIADDLTDYNQKKDDLVSNITATQRARQKLKTDFGKAQTEKDRITIKARTLEETGRLLNFYGRLYRLNLSKIEAILPNLDNLRVAAQNSPLGKAAKKLRNPEFKRNISSFYANISAMTTLFDNLELNKEIAGLLRENELLYRRGAKGAGASGNIIKEIDRVADYLRSIYAKTTLKARAMEQERVKTELAIELMRFALALKPIQHTIAQINPEGAFEVPEINVEEFIDPILNDNQKEDGFDSSSYELEANAILQRYQNGLDF